MKDNKQWYEKLSIWIAIIAGICGILGISVFDNRSLFKNAEADSEIINYESDDKKDNNDNTIEDGNSIQEETFVSDSQKDNSQEVTDGDIIFSEEELFIERNFDLIQELKTKYLYEDTEIIKNDSVEFYIYESAGYIFQDLIKTEECNKLLLMGDGVPYTKVIILDYYSDEVIYTFSPENSHKISYSPGDQNIFYCVVFHNNYDIYVSSPIQVVGGKYQNIINIGLEGKHSEYTPLFQIRLYAQNNKSDATYSIVSDGYGVQYHCENKYTNNPTVTTQIWTSNSGMLSIGQYSYFCLNTNYLMDISLFAPSDDISRFNHQTFDGSITDSNIVELYFSIDSEVDTGEQIKEQ
ncbi:MAG: hypothetical protein HDR29_03660 [Lachnospiraceae bacterium]|nr:hypothetical protein [Lachnospiraceae bacterium]